MTEKTGRERCYICGGGNKEILETHHIVPRRYDGDDSAENLVDLCPSCHEALEKLYNKRFYKELGVAEATTEITGLCGHDDCCAEADRLVSDGWEVFLCENHYQCNHKRCSKNPEYVLDSVNDTGLIVCCEQHARCSEPRCYSTNTQLVKTVSDYGYGETRTFCKHHTPTEEEYEEVTEAGWA